MEVEVRVDVEDLFTGHHATAATAFLTYVAMDDGGRPVPVPPLRPETPAETERMRAAAGRRAERLARRRGLGAGRGDPSA
jgi:acyl-CoA hydrolase